MYESEKLQEAEYFYNSMLQELQNPEHFKYNLGAFLSASRSVLQHARKEAITKNGGEKWYIELMKSKVLCFFRNQRNAEIHAEPVRPSQYVDITVQETFQMRSTVSITKIDVNGNVVEIYSPSQEADVLTLPNSPPTIDYHYRFLDKCGTEDDVLILAKMYLDELNNVVIDGIAKKFLTP